jgi:hypothetical protein
MDRSWNQLAMSRDVELLADQAARDGHDHRAAELRDVAAHLRAKAGAGRQPPRRPEPVLDRRGQLLLAVGVVLPLVCLALVLLVS